jgi:hypothetical protein
MKAALLVVALVAIAVVSVAIGTGPFHQSESTWAEVLGWTTALSLLGAAAVVVVAPLRALLRRRGGKT